MESAEGDSVVSISWKEYMNQNNRQLGLGINRGYVEENRSRSMSEGVLRHANTDDNEGNRKRSVSDSSLQLARRRIENEEEIEGRNTKAKIAIFAQLSICNILECWKCIIHRYVQPGDFYQIVIPLRQVSKFWNNEVKAFLLERLISQYKEDEVAQMDRFELLKNPGDEGFPIRWIQNILVLYFAAVNRLKELEDQVDLEKVKDQISACQSYKTLFNQFFDECISAWVREGFHFSVKYEKDWNRLNDNDSFTLQFSGQKLTLRPKERQEGYLLSRFFEKYLFNQNYLELIKKDDLWMVKIGQTLCQNKASKIICELLNNFSRVLCDYYNVKDWGLKKIDWKLEGSVLRVLECFAQRGLLSIEDAESLLFSVVKMFHNVKAGRIAECGIDLLVSFARVNLISVETILFNLINIKSMGLGYHLGRTFNLRFTDKWIKDCFKDFLNNEIKRSAELNKNKLKNCLIEWLNASDYDKQVFALRAALCWYGSSSKEVLQVKQIAMDLILKLAKSPLISKVFSKRLMDLAETKFGNYVDFKESGGVTGLHIKAEFELKIRIETLLEKLSVIVENLQKELDGIKESESEDNSEQFEDYKKGSCSSAFTDEFGFVGDNVENEELKKSRLIKDEEFEMEEAFSVDKPENNCNLEINEVAEVEGNVVLDKEIFLEAKSLDTSKRGTEIQGSSYNYLMFVLVIYFLFLVFFDIDNKI